MPVPKEILKDRGYSLEGHVGKGVGDDIGKQDIFEGGCQYVDHNEKPICSHNFEEGEIEALPLDSNSEHVVHHDNAEEEQGEDDKFEHDPNEHAHEP